MNWEDLGGVTYDNLEQSKLSKTNWGNYPVRTRKTLDTFQNEAGFEPGAWLKKRWAAGAQDWVAEFGENSSDLLIRAMRYMRKQTPPLVIKDPRSCITVAYHLLENDRRENDRSKYTTGAYADLYGDD